MNLKAYIDAASRASMCASFAIADANEGNPHRPEPITERELRSRIEQIEGYARKMREAL